ncbi:15698_t:CDS:2, partial [Funneliformis mosseae]
MQQTYDSASIEDEIMELVDSLMTQDPYNLDVKLSQHELELVEESYKETIPKLDYGTCMKCAQLRSHYQWCQRC